MTDTASSGTSLNTTWHSSSLSLSAAAAAADGDDAPPAWRMAPNEDNSGATQTQQHC